MITDLQRLQILMRKERTVTGDVHVHSYFSTDSEARMEDSIEKAIGDGLSFICFTDHIDYDYPVSGLTFEFDPADYFGKIEEMRSLYGNRIKILAGVELGLQEHLAKRYSELLKAWPFDFAIGSQHLVGGLDPYYPETFEGRSESDVYRQYFEDMLTDLRAFHEFDTLGHLDYIVRYGPRKGRSYSYRQYADVIDEILKLLVRNNNAIEINTAGLRKQLGFPNPHPDILRRYRELGGTLVTMGSDAHKPHAIGFGFGAARDILKNCGFTHMVYYEKRMPRFVLL